MDQARQANCYYSIIKQFAENRSNYHEEMSISSAFYSYTYNALVVATFMELAKIYDSHRQSTNIQHLIKECKENISYFPTFSDQYEETVNGKKHTVTFPFRHSVAESEKEFFREEIERKKPFQKLFGDINYPIHVEMTIERYFKLYEWRLTYLESQISHLLKQRNKIYAHNDKITMDADLDTVINQFPLNHKEIDELILFALDFCRFAYAMLTGINSASAPVNIDDWTNTLIRAQLGEKYQEVEIQKQMDDFKNNL